MSKTKELIRSLHEAINHHGHLYSDDELRFMKTQLRQLTEDTQQLLKEEKNGFGS